MMKNDRMGVQQEPRRGCCISVERVAQYRVADLFQVNPQLV